MSGPPQLPSRGRLAPALGPIAALALLAACDARNSTITTEQVSASAVRDPVLDDIPKPAGFALVADRSVYRQSGKYRVGKCEYLGAADQTTIKRFYEEYMPSAGFQKREVGLDRGEYSMRFESDQEICNIRIRREQRQTAVVVEIGPRPSGSTEPGRQPPARRPG